MEHIVQFGVTIDDGAIQKLVADRAAEAVIADIRNLLGCGNRYSDENVVRRMVEEEVEKQFDKLSDKIIEATSDKLADKLLRTKKVKEATQKVLENVLGE